MTATIQLDDQVAIVTVPATVSAVDNVAPFVVHLATSECRPRSIGEESNYIAANRPPVTKEPHS